MHLSIRRRALAALFAAALLPVARAAPRPLALANVYRDGTPLADYWVSEKLDGVRAYWDGTRLWTRNAHPIHTPAWFTAGWPSTPLDGELWAGRGRFTVAASAAARDTPDDATWRALRYMAFDLPAHPGTFDARWPALQRAVATVRVPWLSTVEQRRVADAATLQSTMVRVVKQGGEGLMLRRGSSLYRGERSDDLLKLKPHLDAEATVIAHLPGQGKYHGLLGALWVETPEGRRFRIGSGLRDADRRQPPPIGGIVTYRYRGHHPGGLPRFATFLRVRPPE